MESRGIKADSRFQIPKSPPSNSFGFFRFQIPRILPLKPTQIFWSNSRFQIPRFAQVIFRWRKIKFHIPKSENLSLEADSQIPEYSDFTFQEMGEQSKFRIQNILSRLQKIKCFLHHSRSHRAHTLLLTQVGRHSHVHDIAIASCASSLMCFPKVSRHASTVLRACGDGS